MIGSFTQTGLLKSMIGAHRYAWLKKCKVGDIRLFAQVWEK